MLKEISLEKIADCLDRGLSLVECVEYHHMMAVKRLSMLVDKFGLDGVPIRTHMADVYGITSDMLPKTEFSMSNRRTVGGSMPYNLAVKKYGDRFGLSRELIEESSRGLDLDGSILTKTYPEYPHEQIADYAIEIADDIARTCGEIANMAAEADSNSASYEMFIKYLQQNNVEFPSNYREGFCRLFSQIMASSQNNDE